MDLKRIDPRKLDDGKTKLSTQGGKAKAEAKPLQIVSPDYFYKKSLMIVEPYSQEKSQTYTPSQPQIPTKPVENLQISESELRSGKHKRKKIIKDSDSEESYDANKPPSPLKRTITPSSSQNQPEKRVDSEAVGESTKVELNQGHSEQTDGDVEDINELF